MREGWSYKKLGEVCSSIKDGSHNPPKGCSFSEYIMISSQNIFNEELRLEDVRYLGYDDFIIEDKRTNLRAGDVLLTIVGTIGRCYVFKGNEGNITLQRSVAVLSPKDFIDSRFLMYSLRGKNQVLADEAHGIAQKGIYLKQLSSLEISYPNVSTQQQIVSELDLLSHILDQKRQQLKEYDALAESIFYDMFGDPVENPKGWEVKKLGDICNISSSKRIFANEYVDEGIPFYRGKEVTEKSKGLDPTLELFISRDRYAQIKESFGVPKVGDILITAVGTIGNIWVVDNDDPFYFKDGNIIWLSQISNIDPIYFRKVLEILISAFKLEMSNGCAYSALTIVNLKKMGANLPPLTLQRSFAAKIESIEHQKQLLRASIKETEMLFQSRMDYWFNS